MTTKAWGQIGYVRAITVSGNVCHATDCMTHEIGGYLYNINVYIRVTQIRKDSKKCWKLYNSMTGDEYDLNDSMYEIIDKINNKCFNNRDALIRHICLHCFIRRQEANSLLDFLLESNIVTKSIEKKINNNILKKCKYKFPLMYLMFVLTDRCNLKCVHCYGNYGKTVTDYDELDYSKLVELMTDLDCLHTSTVSFTGGEFFLYEHYQEIFDLFIQRGYKVTIFTNGFCTEKIAEFMAKNNRFAFKLKVSLDGKKDVHNAIRGNNFSYDNAIRTIELANEYRNVEVSVSTTILKENLVDLISFTRHVKEQFPNAVQDIDIGFPPKLPIDECFLTLTEIKELYSKNYSLFHNKSSQKKIYRCEGGRSLACLDSNLDLKICVIADTNDFIFGNIKSKSLKDLWVNPPKAIDKFRHEKVKSTKLCKNCKMYHECTATDCRIRAQKYTGDCNLPCPLTCILETVTYELSF